MCDVDLRVKCVTTFSLISGASKTRVRDVVLFIVVIIIILQLLSLYVYMKCASIS